jgi:hypothetical protein
MRKRLIDLGARGWPQKEGDFHSVQMGACMMPIHGIHWGLWNVASNHTALPKLEFVSLWNGPDRFITRLILERLVGWAAVPWGGNGFFQGLFHIITIPHDNLDTPIGQVTSYNPKPSISISLVTYPLLWNLGCHWPNDLLTFCCLDEDFITNHCVDEKRAFQFTWWMVMSSNWLECAGYCE